MSNYIKLFMSAMCARLGWQPVTTTHQHVLRTSSHPQLLSNSTGFSCFFSPVVLRTKMLTRIPKPSPVPEASHVIQYCPNWITELRNCWNQMKSALHVITAVHSSCACREGSLGQTCTFLYGKASQPLIPFLFWTERCFSQAWKSLFAKRRGYVADLASAAPPWYPKALEVQYTGILLPAAMRRLRLRCILFL